MVDIPTEKRKFDIKEFFRPLLVKPFRQLLVMYNNKYPRRNVFIRMPIDKDTTVEESNEIPNVLNTSEIRQYSCENEDF